MTDQSRKEILENHYQTECATIRIGNENNAFSFITRGYTRGLLIVAIMEEMELFSEKEIQERRHTLEKLRKGEKEEWDRQLKLLE